MARLRPYPSAVAMPVRDEEEQLGGCLAALLDQSELPDHIVLLINNTTDRLAEVARRMVAGARTEVHVIERQLPAAEANAGTARRLAMDAAAELVGHRGALLTTDADGRVPRHWVAINMAWLSAGMDAVCGKAAIDPVDEAAIAAHLVADDAADARYTELLDEIDSLLDPRPHDPWPRHRHCSGASIAVSAAVYCAVGGLPTVPHGEDRALIAASKGGTVRSGMIRVWKSSSPAARSAEPKAAWQRPSLGAWWFRTAGRTTAWKRRRPRCGASGSERRRGCTYKGFCFELGSP